MCDAMEGLVREESDEDGPWQAERGEDDTDGPLLAIDVSDAECTTTNEDDGDLCTNHDAVDANEEVVVLQTSENVELVIQTTIVELVEDLHPNESVENHGVELKLLCRVAQVVLEDSTSSEVEDESDNQLEDSLTDDHLPHVHCNERCLLACWFALEDDWSWGISSKRESCKCVHDQVNPEKLHSCKDRFHVRIGDSRDEGE